MQASSLPAPCPTRNQAGGGQPLNHRMTLSETAAHSSAALHCCAGTVVSSTFGSKVYWKVSTLLLCIYSPFFLVKESQGLFLRITDSTVLQVMGSGQDATEAPKRPHTPIYICAHVFK